MRIDVRLRDEVDVVQVSGALDMATTPRLRAVLEARLAEGRGNLVVDLAEVRMLGADAVGMLTGVAKKARRAGGELAAVGARGLRAEVLQILRSDRAMSVYDEPAEALARFVSEPPSSDQAAAGPKPAGVTAFVPSQASPVDPIEDQEGDSGRWPRTRDITVHALIAAVRRLPEDSRDRAELRRQAIEDCIPYARRLARRFRDRGEPGEDLTQVAMVGLVNAIDGYDPDRGCEFTGYATPTIVGELRRYFRDKGWRIKVPRRLQELRLQVNRATVELSQTMGGSPTVRQLAEHLHVEEDEVAEAIEAGRLYHPLSLSATLTSDSDADLLEPIGEEDRSMAIVDERESVRPLLATLPEREKTILALRFFGDMTQSQIADRLGISQMHVSRLLSQTLDGLRAKVADAA